jgi:sigma-B regulation protein RsbU (phosphoserine phosphatase)
MIPAKEVGGDLYDFFLVDEDHLAVVIGDVSGKGVAAALFMVISKTMLKNSAQSGKRPAEIFRTVNNQLCQNNKGEMFVTSFMGILEISTGEFVYVNAGHNPPLLKKSGGDFEWLPVEPGFVLAGLEDFPFPEVTVQLGEGDILFLYTDGVTEAVNTENELYSDDRLLEVLNDNTDRNVHELIRAVKADIDRFSEGAQQSDDIAMLALMTGNERRG